MDICNFLQTYYLNIQQINIFLRDNEIVFVARKNARPIVISVADDDDFLSKAELLSIQKGLEDIKNGRTYKMQEGESLTDFLKRTEACIK